MMLFIVRPNVCVNNIVCLAVLTRAVAPLLLTLFRRLHRRHRHLSCPFSRLCNELALLSGCRHGDTGRDPR